MKLKIQGTNIEINKALREFVEEKLGSLRKFHEDLRTRDKLEGDGMEERVDMEVELEKTRPDQRKGKIFRAEAQFLLSGKLFRSEAIESDIKSAVVEVKDELQRQIKEFKGKKRAKLEKGGRRAKKQM